MTLFEEKVNEYRENKRLIEELEAMNDAIRADIITMMHARRRWCRARQRPFIRMCRASDLIASFCRPHTRIFMPSAAKRPFTSGSAWFDRRYLICVWLLLMAALLLSVAQPQKALFVTLAFGILTTGEQSQNDIILCPVHFLVFLCAVQSI